MDRENLQINKGKGELARAGDTELHNTPAVLDAPWQQLEQCQEEEPEARTEFTGKLYRAGRTLLLRVPKICADIEGVKPGDQVRVAIRKMIEKQEAARV